MAYSSHAFFDVTVDKIVDIPDATNVVIRLEAGDTMVSLHFRTLDEAIAFATSIANGVTVHAQGKEA